MRFIILAVVALLIVGGLVAVVRGLSGRRKPVAQPIVFDHALHLDKAGLQCLDCHRHAETRVFAGLPDKDICLDCHDIDDIEEQAGDPGANPELVKLVSFADSDRSIPWVRVALTRPDVFFSHRRHVTAGGIDCLRCHPDQPKLTAPPPTAELVMTMDDCIHCHEENGVSTDCLACHR